MTSAATKHKAMQRHKVADILRGIATKADRQPLTAAEFAARLKSYQLLPVEFARLAGVYESAVSRWINGVNPIPGWISLVFELLDILTDQQPGLE